MKQLIELVGKLDKKDVGLKSLQENIDTTTSGGKLIFHVFGALAQFEAEVIRERTNAGLEVARARGKVAARSNWMRRKLPWPSNYSKTRTRQ